MEKSSEVTAKGTRTKKVAQKRNYHVPSFVCSFISSPAKPGIQLRDYAYKYMIFDRY